MATATIQSGTMLISVEFKTSKALSSAVGGIASDIKKAETAAAAANAEMAKGAQQASSGYTDTGKSVQGLAGELDRLVGYVKRVAAAWLVFEGIRAITDFTKDSIEAAKQAENFGNALQASLPAGESFAETMETIGKSTKGLLPEYEQARIGTLLFASGLADTAEEAGQLAFAGTVLTTVFKAQMASWDRYIRLLQDGSDKLYDNFNLSKKLIDTYTEEAMATGNLTAKEAEMIAVKRALIEQGNRFSGSMGELTTATMRTTSAFEDYKTMMGEKIAPAVKVVSDVTTDLLKDAVANYKMQEEVNKILKEQPDLYYFIEDAIAAKMLAMTEEERAMAAFSDKGDAFNIALLAAKDAYDARLEGMKEFLSMYPREISANEALAASRQRYAESSIAIAKVAAPDVKPWLDFSNAVEDALNGVTTIIKGLSTDIKGPDIKPWLAYTESVDKALGSVTAIIPVSSEITTPDVKPWLDYAEAAESALASVAAIIPMPESITAPDVKPWSDFADAVERALVGIAAIIPMSDTVVGPDVKPWLDYTESIEDAFGIVKNIVPNILSDSERDAYAWAKAHGIAADDAMESYSDFVSNVIGYFKNLRDSQEDYDKTVADAARSYGETAADVADERYDAAKTLTDQLIALEEDRVEKIKWVHSGDWNRTKEQNEADLKWWEDSYERKKNLLVEKNIERLSEIDEQANKENARISLQLKEAAAEQKEYQENLKLTAALTYLESTGQLQELLGNTGASVTETVDAINEGLIDINTDEWKVPMVNAYEEINKSGLGSVETAAANEKFKEELFNGTVDVLKEVGVATENVGETTKTMGIVGGEAAVDLMNSFKVAKKDGILPLLTPFELMTKTTLPGFGKAAEKSTNAITDDLGDVITDGTKPLGTAIDALGTTGLPDLGAALGATTTGMTDDIGDTKKEAVDPFTAAIVNIWTTAEGPLGDLDDALGDIKESLEEVKLAAEAAAAAIRDMPPPRTDGGTGGGSGGGGQIIVPPGTRPGEGAMAMGGSFTVPSGFPNDSYTIGLTSGERVDVRTRGQVMRGFGSGTQPWNISFPEDPVTGEDYVTPSQGGGVDWGANSPQNANVPSWGSAMGGALSVVNLPTEEGDDAEETAQNIQDAYSELAGTVGSYYGDMMDTQQDYYDEVQQNLADMVQMQNEAQAEIVLINTDSLAAIKELDAAHLADQTQNEFGEILNYGAMKAEMLKIAADYNVDLDTLSTDHKEKEGEIDADRIANEKDNTAKLKLIDDKYWADLDLMEDDHLEKEEEIDADRLENESDNTAKLKLIDDEYWADLDLMRDDHEEKEAEIQATRLENEGANTEKLKQIAADYTDDLDKLADDHGEEEEELRVRGEKDEADHTEKMLKIATDYATDKLEVETSNAEKLLSLNDTYAEKKLKQEKNLADKLIDLQHSYDDKMEDIRYNASLKDADFAEDEADVRAAFNEDRLKADDNLATERLKLENALADSLRYIQETKIGKTAAQVAGEIAYVNETYKDGMIEAEKEYAEAMLKPNETLADKLEDLGKEKVKAETAKNRQISEMDSDTAWDRSQAEAASAEDIIELDKNFIADKLKLENDLTEKTAKLLAGRTEAETDAGKQLQKKKDDLTARLEKLDHEYGEKQQAALDAKTKSDKAANDTLKKQQDDLNTAATKLDHEYGEKQEAALAAKTKADNAANTTLKKQQDDLIAAATKLDHEYGEKQQAALDAKTKADTAANTTLKKQQDDLNIALGKLDKDHEKDKEKLLAARTANEVTASDTYEKNQRALTNDLLLLNKEYAVSRQVALEETQATIAEIEKEAAAQAAELQAQQAESLAAYNESLKELRLTAVLTSLELSGQLERITGGIAGTASEAATLIRAGLLSVSGDFQHLIEETYRSVEALSGDAQAMASANVSALQDIFGMPGVTPSITPNVIPFWPSPDTFPTLGPGFQHGADFTVPPGWYNDSFPIRASSGEHVNITPAGQSYGSSFNINVAGNMTHEAADKVIRYAKIMSILGH